MTKKFDGDIREAAIKLFKLTTKMIAMADGPKGWTDDAIPVPSVVHISPSMLELATHLHAEACGQGEELAHIRAEFIETLVRELMLSGLTAWANSFSFSESMAQVAELLEELTNNAKK